MYVLPSNPLRVPDAADPILMSRRPALFRQSDLLRAMKVAQKSGAWAVDILPNGTIRCVTAPNQDWKPDANPQKDSEWDNVR